MSCRYCHQHGVSVHTMTPTPRFSRRMEGNLRTSVRSGIVLLHFLTPRRDLNRHHLPLRDHAVCYNCAYARSKQHRTGPSLGECGALRSYPASRSENMVGTPILFIVSFGVGWKFPIWGRFIIISIARRPFRQELIRQYLAHTPGRCFGFQRIKYPAPM